MAASEFKMAEATRPSSGDPDAVAEGGFTGKCLPEVTQRAEMLATDITLLLGTLDNLSESELERFMADVDIGRCIKYPGDVENLAVVVCSMVLAYGQQSVEKTKKVLREMKRTDLVGQLSYISTALKKKQSVNEHWSRIHAVAVKRAVKELVVETLSDLSPAEFPNFKRSLHDFYIHLGTFHREHPKGDGLEYYSRKSSQAFLGKLELADKADKLVELMVDVWGQMYVDVISKTLVDVKRTDLQLKLSGLSSEPRESDCVDWPAWIEKEAKAKESVIELLLETLAGLSYWEHEEFSRFMKFKVPSPRNWPSFPFDSMAPQISRQDVVFFMVLHYYKDPVEKTKEVLQRMNRTDLVHRLSHSSSGPKKHRTALIRKVATVAAVIHVLWETLNGLNHGELRDFKNLVPMLPKDYLVLDDVSSDCILDWMLDMFGSRSLEITRDILQKINREDLMKRLCVSSQACKVSQSSSGDEAAAPIPIPLLENLVLVKLHQLDVDKGLRLQWLLHLKSFMMGFSLDPLQHDRWTPQYNTHLLAKQIVEVCGQQWMEVLEAEELEADEFELLEILEDVGDNELKQLQEVLYGLGILKRGTKAETEKRDRSQIAERMKMIYGQNAVVTIRRILEKNRQMSDRGKGEEATPRKSKWKLVGTLRELSFGELEEFKYYLQNTRMKKGLPRISKKRMETADCFEIATLIMEFYGQRSMEVTQGVLTEMRRLDLVQTLSDSSSGSKEPLGSAEPEGCGSILHDSSDWTKVEPEVSGTDEDDAPTYSLQSEAGNFECSVSGLRWVCTEEISFQYQFCCWETHLERIECLQYAPAGPMIDINVITGKFLEVHLPHWVCLDVSPKISDKFAVLHIDDGGDVVEKVPEVTSHHVKLPEPDFSPRAVLIKLGFPLKINCNVVIYKLNRSFLTLHVYLLPADPGLQQKIAKDYPPSGSQKIHKPQPDTALKMRDRFKLTANMDTAEIGPKNIKLRYEFTNFYEVFLENPDTDFELNLKNINEDQPLWTCTIRRGDYQSTVQTQESASAMNPSQTPASAQHFVDQHEVELIDRVSSIASILDQLLADRVISRSDYDAIDAIPARRDKMRKLYSGPLNAAGPAGKDIFLRILEKEHPFLVADLRKKQS